MKILFAVSNENVSNRIVDSYKKRYQDTVSFKNVFYFNAIIRELQRDKSYDSIVISEDLEPFANSNYDVIDRFIVERLQEVSQEVSKIGKEVGIIVICTDRRTKTSYVLNKLYEYGIYNALVGADRRIDNVCSLINTPRTMEEAKEYYNIQEDELGNNLDDVSEQEVQNILIHYKKLGKNEDRYTDSFNNIASQYNDKQLRIIIKCLPINVRAVLEAECPKYQELVTTQDETEEERIQKEKIQEERKIEKEENDKKLQAKIEKERREAEKRALKEQKAAEKAAAKANRNPAQNNEIPQIEKAPEIPTAPRTEGMPTNTATVSSATENGKIGFASPKINTSSGASGIDLIDNKMKEPRMTGNVIIPGSMNIRNERKIISDDELNNQTSSPREPINGNEQIPSQEVASPISAPEDNIEAPMQDAVLPGIETPAVESQVEAPMQDAVLPGIETPTVENQVEAPMQDAVLPGFETPTVENQVETPMQDAVLPGIETPAVENQVEAPMQDAVLPGIETPAVENQVETPMQDAVLPGIETPTVENQVEAPMQDAVLPGFETPTVENQVETPMQDAVLPGIETPAVENQVEAPMQDAVLPGFENLDSNSNTQNNEVNEIKEERVIFPEFEEIDNPIVEQAVQGPSTTGTNTDEFTPHGFEQQPVMETNQEQTENVVEEPPTVNNMHIPDLSNVEDILENQLEENVELPNSTIANVEEPNIANENTMVTNNEETVDSDEPKKRGRGRPRKYPVEPQKPKGKRGRPRKYPLPGEIETPQFENTEISNNISIPTQNVAMQQTQPSQIQTVETVAPLANIAQSNVQVPEKIVIQTPTGPIEVEKQVPVENETNDMEGFEDVKVSSTYVEKVTADNIEVPEENIQIDTNPIPTPEVVQNNESILPGLEPPNQAINNNNTITTVENVPEPVLPGFEPPVVNNQPEATMQNVYPEGIVDPVANTDQINAINQTTEMNTQVNTNTTEQPVQVTQQIVEPVMQASTELGQTNNNQPQQPSQAKDVSSFIPVNDLFEEVQTVQLNSSNTVNQMNQDNNAQIVQNQVNNNSNPIEQNQNISTIQEPVIQQMPEQIVQPTQNVQDNISQQVPEQIVQPTQIVQDNISQQVPEQIVQPTQIVQDNISQQVPEQIVQPTQIAQENIPQQMPEQNMSNQFETPNISNGNVEPLQGLANNLESQVQDMKQNMGFETITNTNAQNPYEVNNNFGQEQNFNQLSNDLPSNDNFELNSSNIQTNVESSIDSQFESIAGPQMAEEPVAPVQNQNNNIQTDDMFSNFDNITNNTYPQNNAVNEFEENEESEKSYEDLYASTVSSKRLQADVDNPQNNVTVEQNASTQNYENTNYQEQGYNQTQDYNQMSGFEVTNNTNQNYGMGPQIETNPQVQAYVPNDNRMESIQALEDNRAYSSGTLSQVLTKDKKIVCFVGAPKSGTSFLVNNLANLFSSLGIRTAILDMTRNKNSYFIYTNNDENLRNTAYNCIENLENGIAEGIMADRNLDVYTAVPNDGKDYTNAESILTTLVQNESLVLVDCDFTTPWGYFANASEIYLVQSMDILTIQPLTGFLRELKTRGLLEQDKLRVVINKELKVKGLSSKVIIGGMSFYNDPAMSFMTELFNKDRIKACSIPFDTNVYSKYLEQIVNCQITISGYPKGFMNSLKILGNMVYPLLSKQTYSSNNSGGQGYGNSYGNQGYGNNFSPEMNNTLNQMRNKY